MKQLVPFAKYHGLGNDFVIIDARELARDRAGFDLLNSWNECCPKLAQYLCNRSFGIGADGLILALPIEENHYEGVELSRSYPAKGRSRKAGADFPRRHTAGDQSEAEPKPPINEVRGAVEKITRDYKNTDSCLLAWVYTNSDGSAADMCGNGLRALSLWTKNNLDSDIEQFSIATAYGAIQSSINSDLKIKVDFGEPTLESASIPVSGQARSPVVGEEISIKGQTINLSAVGMGNPHAVIFDQFSSEVRQSYEQIEQFRKSSRLPDRESFFPVELKEVSTNIQAHELFPESANVEFVNVLSKDAVEVLVYERGCGPTLACASGAAAVAVAGILAEKLSRAVMVKLPGGDLKIEWNKENNHIYMEGSAKEVFSGVVWVDMATIMGKQAEASCS